LPPTPSPNREKRETKTKTEEASTPTPNPIPVSFLFPTINLTCQIDAPSTPKLPCGSAVPTRISTSTTARTAAPGSAAAAAAVARDLHHLARLVLLGACGATLLRVVDRPGCCLTRRARRGAERGGAAVTAATGGVTGRPEALFPVMSRRSGGALCLYGAGSEQLGAGWGCWACGSTHRSGRLSGGAGGPGDPGTRRPEEVDWWVRMQVDWWVRMQVDLWVMQVDALVDELTMNLGRLGGERAILDQELWGSVYTWGRTRLINPV